MSYYSSFGRYAQETNSSGVVAAASMPKNDFKWTASGIQVIGVSAAGTTNGDRARQSSDYYLCNTAFTAAAATLDCSDFWTVGTELSLGFAVRLENSAPIGTAIASITDGTNKYSFGLNGKFACLLANGSVVATSTVDLMTRKGVASIGLDVNTSGGVTLFVNGNSVATSAQAALAANASIVLDFPNIAYTIKFSDISVEPNAYAGPVRIGSFKSTTSDLNTGWTGTANLGTAPPQTSQFIEATGAAEKRSTYTTNQVIKPDMSFTSIKKAIYMAIASAGTGGADLHLSITQAGTITQDSDVSAPVTANGTGLTLTKLEMSSDPTAGTAWTKASLESAKTSVRFV